MTPRTGAVKRVAWTSILVLTWLCFESSGALGQGNSGQDVSSENVRGPSDATRQVGQSSRGPSLCPVPAVYRPISAADQRMATAILSSDTFPSEQRANELSSRLHELSSWLRKRVRKARTIATFLADNFQSTRLQDQSELRAETGALTIWRAATRSALELTREGFVDEFSGFVKDFQEIRIADFQIVSLVEEGQLVRTTVDYTIAGNATKAWRLQISGLWNLDWTIDSEGRWRIVKWVSLDQTRSSSLSPVFVDVSDSALGENLSFNAQLRRGIGDWQAILDEALGTDIYGNNGVAVGDIDGDGWDDLYVCQPPGLPNRLYRNRGNGTFEDLTNASRVGVLDPSSMALFADVDNDNDQDLIVITRTQPLLFLNNGKAEFTHRVDAFSFLQEPRGTFTAASLSDFDRDGDLDLYVATYAYFLGNVSSQVPLPYHDANNGPPNILLRNDGKGFFTEATQFVGINQNNHRFSFACAWLDYNDDGWPDLYVANDFGRNNLYRNNGGTGTPLTFTDVADSAGVEDIGAGMSVTALDYEHNGRMDLFVGNMWSAEGQRITEQDSFQREASAEVRLLYQRHAKGNSLFRNQGDGTFTEVSSLARVEKGCWAWGADTLDFDNDSWEDIYIMCGFITNYDERDLSSFFWRRVAGRSPLTTKSTRVYEDAWRAINRQIREDVSFAGRERNMLLRNDGSGGFDDISGTAGVDISHDGRAFAVTDYDQDGDPDLFVIGRGSPQLRLLRNEFHTQNSAVAIRLGGVESNWDAIGAKVTLKTAASWQTKIVQGGSGFLSQHSKELIFGLGMADRVQQVTIVWPSGRHQHLSNVPINHRIHVREGSDSFQSEPFRTQNLLSPASLNQSPVRASSGTWLLEPYPAPDFSLTDLKNKTHRLSQYRGNPTLITFWTSLCQSCLDQVYSFADWMSEPTPLDLTLLTVCLDPPQHLDKMKAWVGDRRIDISVLLANGAAVGTYSVLSKYLFGKHQDLDLPATFLVDGEGKLQKFYRGPLELSQLLLDLKQLRAEPSDRLSLALPFEGEYYQPIPRRDYFQLGFAFAEADFLDPSLLAWRRAVDDSPNSAEAHYNLGIVYVRKGLPKLAQRSFGWALDLNPNYAEAHNNLGMVLGAEGQLQQAINEFKAAVRLRPEYAIALNNLGRAYMQSGAMSQAQRALTKALEAKPNYPEALNNLGILYGNLGKIEEAELFFEKALAERADYPQAVSNLAMVYGVMGKLQEAIALLEQSLIRNPDNETAYMTLAQIYFQGGMEEKSTRILSDLLRRNPEQREAQTMLRQIQDRRESRRQADPR